MLFARSRSKVGLSFIIALCFGVAQGPIAFADDADLAQGRKLYSQGLTQEAAGDWAGALSSFEEVAKVKMTPQVRFHIARCKEKLGRWNEALGGYRLAEYEAEGSADISSEISKARTELETKIPKLVIERGRGADTIKVELDSVVLGDTQIGAEIAVDPGKHVVVGIVSGGRKFRRQITVEAGKTERLVLDVPDELASEDPGEARAPVVAQNESPKVDEKKRGGDSAAPFILGGIGLASLIGAAVFYKLRNDAEQELDSGCLGKTCPDTLQDTQSRGQTYAALSGVMLGIGIVGIGAGTLLFVSRPSSSSETTSRYRPSVGVGPRGGGVSFGGSF